MALDPSGTPEAVRLLVESLERDGFLVTGTEGSGSINRLVELAHADCEVRITADRGDWWIELGGAALGDWFDPDIWAACIDHVPVVMEPADLHERVDFVLRRWREVAQAIAADRGIRTCLDRTRSTRARTRLGLPPRVDD